ncbi:hypothetical protein [Klebsiella pneumoniae]|nr:hypothetical protein [Klebsiella pneumoniae]
MFKAQGNRRGWKQGVWEVMGADGSGWKKATVAGGPKAIDYARSKNL